MLRKFILPVVLLIFTQQEFYGMKERKEDETLGTITNKDPWETINCMVNMNLYTGSNEEFYPKLWWLWAILDNVPFQYGGSKIWKYGEAYYGLSNGIGFFLSFRNFGWLKVGIGDAHINVINTIIKFMKTYTAIKYEYYYNLNKYSSKHTNPVWLNSLKWWLFYTVVTDIHLFSFKFFNCVKIKIISIGAVVTAEIDDSLLYFDNPSWYFSFRFTSFCERLEVPGIYFILSPRIEINIPGIIDLF